MTDQQFDPSQTAIRRAAKVVQHDLNPQSAEHWVRIVLGGLFIAASAYNFIGHKGVTWTKEDLYAILGFGGIGALIVFTKSVVTALKIVLRIKDKNGIAG